MHKWRNGGNTFLSLKTAFACRCSKLCKAPWATPGLRPARRATVRSHRDSLGHSRVAQFSPILSGVLSCRLLACALRLRLGLCLWLGFRLRLGMTFGRGLAFGFGLSLALLLTIFLELVSRSLAISSMLSLVHCIGHFGSFLQGLVTGDREIEGEGVGLVLLFGLVQAAASGPTSGAGKRAGRGVCFSFRNTGMCQHGGNCRYEHVSNQRRDSGYTLTGPDVSKKSASQSFQVQPILHDFCGFSKGAVPCDDVDSMGKSLSLIVITSSPNSWRSRTVSSHIVSCQFPLRCTRKSLLYTSSL